MNHRKKRLLILNLIVFLLPALAHTQETGLQSLPYLYPQSFVNPAKHPENTVLYLGLYASAWLENSSLSKNDMLEKRDINGKEEIFWDFESIDNSLKDNNYLSSGFRISPLFLGLDLERAGYFSFSLSMRLTSLFEFPATISQLRHGNADLEANLSRTIDLNNYSLNQILFTEISLGYSRELFRGFRLGISLKPMMGISALQTRRFQASIETEDDFSATTLRTDILMNASSDVFETNSSDQISGTGKSLMDFMLDRNSFSLKNRGLGVDIGFHYNAWNRWNVFGSVTDLGRLNWNENPQNLVSKGEYSFEGLYFSPYSVDYDTTELASYLERYADTLSTTFTPVARNEGFQVKTDPHLYFGGGVTVGTSFHFHTMFHFRKLNETWYTGWGLSSRLNVFRNFHLMASFSYRNFSFTNLGAGFLFDYKRFQVFLLSDNLNSFMNPDNARAVNAAVGLNLKFERRKSSRPVF